MVGCTADANTLYFYGHDSPFSNFYPSNITIDGIQFNCVEQAFFYKKSIYLGEPEIGAQILAETQPAIQKKLGESFGQRDWGNPIKALTCMSCIVLEKFTQNKYLAQILLKTGDKILAESNPHDKHWGIGLSAKDAITNGNSWPGNNVMGDILSDVRKKILADTKSMPQISSADIVSV